MKLMLFDKGYKMLNFDYSSGSFRFPETSYLKIIFRMTQLALPEQLRPLLSGLGVIPFVPAHLEKSCASGLLRGC
ncbi:MAG: hypothetical protein ILA04_04905 [Prevotella sp.]|nr:hypothetical protein [Prevotella sp.]